MKRSRDPALKFFLLAFALSWSACVAEPSAQPIATLPSTSTLTTTISPSPTEVKLLLYFTDSDRYAVGTPPFEVAVTRVVPDDGNMPEAAVREFFAGPTEEERAQGLEAIMSGFTGLRAIEIEDGIARVYLSGPCNSRGAAYTIAQPLMRTLLQFEEIEYVKLYDEAGVTEQPDGPVNSIPFCLEP